MNAHGYTVSLEIVVSTPCCRELSESYEWQIFEENPELRLGSLINKVQEEFYEENPQYRLKIEYQIAPYGLHSDLPKSIPVIDPNFIPVCVFDYRSLEDPELRENAIMLLAALKNSHSFVFFPDDANLKEKDRKNLPPGVEFTSEKELRLIFFLNFEFNSKILNKPTMGRYVSDYLFEGG